MLVSLSAAECAESSGNIRDDLDEVITLNSVSVIVAEYIPFGSNQVSRMERWLSACLARDGARDDVADGRLGRSGLGVVLVRVRSCWT